jgi:hypothetical protein
LNVQAERDPWDYGDSDSAYVLPGFAAKRRRSGNGGLGFARRVRFWIIGWDPPELRVEPDKPAHTIEVGDWWFYPKAGLGFVVRFGSCAGICRHWVICERLRTGI